MKILLGVKNWYIIKDVNLYIIVNGKRKERNFIIAFIKNEMNPNLYTFYDVLLLEDGVVINKNYLNNCGLKISSCVKVN